MRWLPLLAAATIAVPLRADDRVDFNRDVRPILSDNCFACHGPDDKKRKADLRLDSADGAKAVLSAGKPGASELVARVAAADEKQMPPKASGKTLTAAQIATLRKWVEQGAEYKAHWSFIPPVRSKPPAAAAEAWVRNDIDRFVLARIEKEGLKPSPEADKTTLIRRVTLDLTGLPPTLAEVDAFLKDDSPDAYEKLVDRLLRLAALRRADGPRLARRRPLRRHPRLPHRRRPRHDPLARLGDRRLQPQPAVRPTSRSSSSPATCLPNATVEQKIASGFNRNHMINFEGGAIPEEYHDRLRRRPREHHRHRLARPDRRLLPVPRPQVRPDHAEGLLPPLRLLQQRAGERPRRQQAATPPRSSKSRGPTTRPASRSRTTTSRNSKRI